MMLRKTLLVLVAAAVTVLTSPSAAQDDGGAGQRTLDLRLAPGAGYFMYPQYVDGGYYIDGQPYDLVWSGLQMHLVGEVQFFVSRRPQLSVGLGGAALVAPRPAAEDTTQTVSVDPRPAAWGGYFGASGSYWYGDLLRLGLLAGYGGAGVSDNGSGFGGHGVALSAAAHYLFPSKNVVGGIGVRTLVMFLSYPEVDDIRAERGTYLAALLEAVGDWIPDS